MAQIKTIAAGHTHADGLCIGDATTSKLAFNGTAPIVQPVSANQAALVDNTGGAVADATLAVVAAAAGNCAGVATPSAAQVDTAIATAVAPLVTAIKDNDAKIAELVNALRLALVNLGLIKGAA